MSRLAAALGVFVGLGTSDIRDTVGEGPAAAFAVEETPEPWAWRWKAIRLGPVAATPRSTTRCSGTGPLAQIERQKLQSGRRIRGGLTGCAGRESPPKARMGWKTPATVQAAVLPS